MQRLYTARGGDWNRCYTNKVRLRGLDYRRFQHWNV